MTSRKKHISRYYTIVEVMVAMGIFLVMMTIMMQFFSSAQKVWNSASKRNFMYADARVAMNVMTREIQSMLYDNDVDGVYPFWHEWQDITDCVEAYDEGINPGNSLYTEDVPDEIKKHFIDNYDLFAQSNGSNPGEPYLTALNFMSTTDLKAVDDASDICEIGYKFIPVYFTTNSPTSVNDVRGGKLVRSCIEELKSDGSSNATKYDFNDYGYQSFTDPLNRVNDVWKDADADDFETVITGVYLLRFSCYTWSSGLKSLKPMSSGGKDTDDNDTGTTYSYNLVTGTPAPVAIRIDMKLMDPKDLKKLAYNIYVAGYTSSSAAEKEAAEKQIKNLKQKIRTFSKVIYLGK